MSDFSKYYRAYMYMQKILSSDFTYNYIQGSLADGDKGKDTLVGKTNEKVIDMDWVEAIEEALPYIQKAIDEQRRFIKQIENVVRIELAKKVGPDSVKHLSQHTNFISKVDPDGSVTPNKVLTVEREESFAIYENRVLMTLIRKALRFVDDKYAKMKDIPDDSYNKFDFTRTLNLNQKKVNVTFNYINEAHETLADDLDVLDVTALSDFDRIRRVRSALNECLNTQLMKEIAKESEVRPPLTQTNLLKKNPNFKKAVELWNFLDTYRKKGFDIVGEQYSGNMSEQVHKDVYFSVGFQHFMLSIATNPALRSMLQLKYEEENRKIEEESKKPEKTRESVMKAKIEAVRKEEMEIRLREIRDREKKILELTTEVKNLKVTLDQKEQQILTLKGQVSALQDQVENLRQQLKETRLKLLEAEKKIAELQEENQALKEEVKALNEKIEKLNETIDSLNKRIIVLNDRIQVLMQENARQQTRINEQDKQIAEQTARITELEDKAAQQLAQITALTENLEKCNTQIAEDEKKITYLSDKNEMLTNNLQLERKNARERVAKMNEDFQNKTKAIEQKHTNDLALLQKKIDDGEIKHSQDILQLNAEFESKENNLQKQFNEELRKKDNDHKFEIDKIRQNNETNATQVNVKHVSEIRKLQKSVDKRIEAAQKEVERRIQHKVDEAKQEARLEIRKAEKKFNEKASAVRDEARAVKNSGELFSRDLTFGTAAYLSAYAEILCTNGEKNIGLMLTDASKNIKGLMITQTRRAVVMCINSQNGAKTVKLYKKSNDIKVAINDISSQLKTNNNSPICITYSNVDKTVAYEFVKCVRQATDKKTILAQNKSIKNEQLIGIYFA